METFHAAILWLYRALATWYVAGIVGGVLILAMERWDRRKEPTDEDVRRAAEQYRMYYGREAERAVDDHMLGASFAPDGRHRQFLKRVAAELLASAAD